MSVVRCPHCGTANRAGSNFCNSCGTELRAAEERAADERAVEPRRQEEETAAEPGPPPAATPETPQPKEPSPGLPAAPQQPHGLADQPWLRMEFGGVDSAPPFDEEDDSARAATARLAPGIQGLLAPVRVTVRRVDDDEPPARPRSPDIPAEQMRLVRQRMGSPPILGQAEQLWSLPASPNLRLPWLFLALGLAILLPALLALPLPRGAPAQWPGVEDAFDVIQGLPAQANVLVYWAYDPAAAGELDEAALPVVEHLLQRRARMSVVSLLPGGPATARRLIERARLEWQRSENLTAAAESAWVIPVQYLPGGAAMLAHVAQNPERVFDAEQQERPDLAVVFGAQAEDVQHWLEQAAPLNRTPVIAVTSAAADPILRPYWNSGQLSGLVSGFDGAYNYQSLLADRLPRLERSAALDRQVVLQDWGLAIFFLAIVLGNLAAMFSRPPEP